MKNFIVIILSLTSFHSWAQKNVFLHLEPLFSNQPFSLQQNYIGNDGVVVEIEHFNYYLSDVILFHDNGQQTNLPTDIWLVTPTQNSLYLGYLNVNQIDSINFTVGVPKRYNTQDGALAQDISTYPETHPLSFQSPSMYWGWSFGYMHMIVGGNADSNNDNIPNAYFELHNLGDNNQQNVRLNTLQTNTVAQIDLNLNCHVDRWLNQIDLSNIGVVHGQAGPNLTILQNVNSQEVFTLAANAGLSENNSQMISWSQTPNVLVLHSKNELYVNGYQLFSSTGQKIQDSHGQEPTAQISLEQLSSGSYLLTLTISNGLQQTLRFVKP
ncbi:MAG: MbnP family protein [Sphingomonadales bacterium]